MMKCITAKVLQELCGKITYQIWVNVLQLNSIFTIQNKGMFTFVVVRTAYWGVGVLLIMSFLLFA